ncbi:hypothetical protein [Dongia sp. agr-C8]
MTWRGLVIALAGFVALFGAQRALAQPIEMMSLWESPGKDDPASAWPAGLRIVIYDDGQVLKLVRAATPTAEAQVVTGHVSPEGAKDRAAATFAMLSGAPAPEDIKADFPERRWTVLQVWDAARKDHAKWSVVGHPCAGLEGSAPDPLDEQVRAALDKRFRDACDMLANTRVPDAVDWSPQTLRIYLTGSDKATDNAAPWPLDWPVEIRQGSYLSVCLDRQAATQELTRKLMSLDKSLQQSAVGMLVKSPDGTNWRVAGIGYALPGPIFHVDRGSDYVNIGSVAEGPCWRP